MKVLHLITRLVVGGAQENTLLTVEDLHRNHGDEVILVTGPDAGPEGSLLERARSESYRTMIVDSLHREILPLSDWRCYWELKQLFHELQPDIIHTHSSKAGILGRFAAAAVGIPVVHTVHGAAFHRGQSGLKNDLFSKLERLAFNKSGHSISVCDAMTEQYVSAGIGQAENYTTIYSGMDVEPFLNPKRLPEDIRKELGITDDGLVIGKIARLFELKGHEYLLEIAPRLIELYPQVHFLLVGDGILRTQIEQRINELGLQAHFHFTGLVKPEEVADYLHVMDIVVHASLREGLARVLPQALISGKPVVSFDIDGAREVCISGETGWLIEPANVEELQKAIIKLIESPADRDRFGNNGRERFTDRFRHESMTEQIREVYCRILAEKKPGSPS